MCCVCSVHCVPSALVLLHLWGLLNDGTRKEFADWLTNLQVIPQCPIAQFFFIMFCPVLSSHQKENLLESYYVLSSFPIIIYKMIDKVMHPFGSSSAHQEFGTCICNFMSKNFTLNWHKIIQVHQWFTGDCWSSSYFSLGMIMRKCLKFWQATYLIEEGPAMLFN